MIDREPLSANANAAIQRFLSKGKAPLYERGGTARLKIVVPRNALLAMFNHTLKDRMHFEANVGPSTCDNCIACVRMDDCLAMSLSHLQFKAGEMLERLRWQTDFRWSNLTAMI